MVKVFDACHLCGLKLQAVKSKLFALSASNFNFANWIFYPNRYCADVSVKVKVDAVFTLSPFPPSPSIKANRKAHSIMILLYKGGPVASTVLPGRNYFHASLSNI